MTTVVYFALAFGLSWGGVLLVIGGLDAVPGTPRQIDVLFPFVYLAMLVGPPVAGVLMTGAVHGRSGLGALRCRLMAWRVDVRAYAIALLAAPLTVMVVLLSLSLYDRAFLPGIFVTVDKVRAVAGGVAIALGAGFFEELGWTGFAIPELRRRFGLFQTGLIMGLLWGLWHFLAVAWGIGDRTGGVPLALFAALDGLSVLPVFRVLMVWLYDRATSLFLAMVMHTSITASLIILGPRVSGVQLLIYDLVLAGTLWVVVACLAVRRAGPQTRRSVAGSKDPAYI